HAEGTAEGVGVEPQQAGEPLGVGIPERGRAAGGAGGALQVAIELRRQPREPEGPGRDPAHAALIARSSRAARYCRASARWSAPTRSLPARSAIVRATRSARS